jgi:hypothetical protein
VNAAARRMSLYLSGIWTIVLIVLVFSIGLVDLVAIVVREVERWSKVIGDAKGGADTERAKTGSNHSDRSEIYGGGVWIRRGIKDGGYMDDAGRYSMNDDHRYGIGTILET